MENKESFQYGLVLPAHHPIIDDALKQNKGSPVLDLGVSFDTSYVNHKSEHANELIGIQFSYSSLERFAERKGQYPSNFSWIQADAKNIPLRNDSINLITMLCLMGDLDRRIPKRITDIEDREKYFEEIHSHRENLKDTYQERVETLIRDSHRVLRDSGTLFISNSTKGQPVVETLEMVKKSFEDVKLVWDDQSGYDEEVKRYILICKK